MPGAIARLCMGNPSGGGHLAYGAAPAPHFSSPILWLRLRRSFAFSEVCTFTEVVLFCFVFLGGWVEVRAELRFEEQTPQ